MKILIYYEQFSLGGVDKHLKELINNWPNKNDQINIITNKNNPGFQKIKKYIKYKNINVIYFNSWSYSSFSNFLINKNLLYLRYITSILQPIFLILTTIKFLLLLKNYEKNSIIFSNNGSYPGSWANIAIIFAAKILKIRKRVMLVHHEALLPRRIIKSYYYFLDNLLSRSLTNLICVSKATLNTIKKRRNLNFKKFQSKIIHNDLKINLKKSNRVLFKNLRKNYILFGIIGRVDLYKGHEDVIKSLSEIESGLRNKIKLLIVGSYNLKIYKRLKNLATRLNVERSVIFKGYINGNSEDIIRNLDVVIVATRDFEGFGYTALEAIKLAKPLITTDVGGIKEFVDPKYVMMVKPKKIKEITSCILKVIKKLKTCKVEAKLYQKKLPKEFIMSKLYRSVFL